MECPFASLEVEAGSAPDVVRKAFKRLSFQYHSDRDPESASETLKKERKAKFIAVSEAWKYLSEDATRKHFRGYGKSATPGKIERAWTRAKRDMKLIDERRQEAELQAAAKRDFMHQQWSIQNSLGDVNNFVGNVNIFCFETREDARALEASIVEVTQQVTAMVERLRVVHDLVENFECEIATTEIANIRNFVETNDRVLKQRRLRLDSFLYTFDTCNDKADASQKLLDETAIKLVRAELSADLLTDNRSSSNEAHGYITDAMVSQEIADRRLTESERHFSGFAEKLNDYDLRIGVNKMLEMSQKAESLHVDCLKAQVVILASMEKELAQKNVELTEKAKFIESLNEKLEEHKRELAVKAIVVRKTSKKTRYWKRKYKAGKPKQSNNEEPLPIIQSSSSAGPSGPSRFECTVCGKSYSRREALSRHQRKHKKDAIFHLCQFCGNSFLRKDNMEMHAKKCRNK